VRCPGVGPAGAVDHLMKRSEIPRGRGERRRGVEGEDKGLYILIGSWARMPLYATGSGIRCELVNSQWGFPSLPPSLSPFSSLSPSLHSRTLSFFLYCSLSFSHSFSPSLSLSLSPSLSLSLPMFLALHRVMGGSRAGLSSPGSEREREGEREREQ